MNLIGKNVGNYRVTKKLGEGGMGAVFLGEHPMIGKKVAIKTLHAELATKEDIISRFFTEAKAVNDIGHPNIVDIVDFGKMRNEDINADVVYFIMEFLDGDGLNVRLKKGISEAQAVHILRQCASALAASHRKNIVHRDLKPDNIYLVTRGEDHSYVKLLDFGIAKLTGVDADTSAHKTRAGLVIGTPAYMSPEQCEGKGEIDSRSDIYSLGMVFFEMLTGRVPFVGEGFGEILVAHLTRTPELPSTLRPEVSPSLEAICMHLIEKDKTRRFQTMDELIKALDDPYAHLEAYGSPSGRVEPAGPTRLMGTVDSDGAPMRPMGGVGSGPSRAMGGPGARPITGQGSKPITGQGSKPITGQGAKPVTGQGAKPITGQGAKPITGQGARPITGQGAAGPQRPTTLSGSTGEVSPDEPAAPARSRTPMFVAAAVIVAGVGGGGFLLMQKPVAPTVASQPVIAATTRTAPVEPELSRVTIDSTPQGASVYRAGRAEVVGKTPQVIEMKRSDPEFDVLIKLDGYKDETRTVNPQRDRDLLVPLARVEPVVPAPVVTPPPVAPVTPAATTKTGAEGVAEHHRPSPASPANPSSGEHKKKGKHDKDDVLEPAFGP